MDHTDILIQIRKIVRSINLDSKKLEKDYGLSIPQLLSLTYLSECQDYQCTQLELRKYLNLNSSTVTGIVSRLIKKGYVAKLPPKQDKRSTQLSLTEDGLEKLKSSPSLLQERLINRLSKLDQKELETVQKGLTILVKSINAETMDASPILTDSEINKQV